MIEIWEYYITTIYKMGSVRHVLDVHKSVKTNFAILADIYLMKLACCAAKTPVNPALT